MNGPKGNESSKDYCNVIDDTELLDYSAEKNGLDMKKNKKTT